MGEPPYGLYTRCNVLILSNIHICKHPPLLLLLVKLVFVLLVPELMDASVPTAQQYLRPSTCVHVELLHMTAITHLLLPPALTLRGQVTYTQPSKWALFDNEIVHSISYAYEQRYPFMYVSTQVFTVLVLLLGPVGTTWRYIRSIHLNSLHIGVCVATCYIINEGCKVL